MNTRNRLVNQKGFSLIELVVVIVLLGILAATAAPKFINISNDAKTATLKAVKGSMQTASSFIYNKAIIAGEQKKTTGIVTVNGLNEPIAFGRPRSNDALAKTSWEHLLELDGEAFIMSASVVSGSIVIYQATDDAPTALTDPCLAYYTEAADANTPPVVGVVDCTS